MYDAFREKRHNCSIERFRQAVREQNIGFTTLSGEMLCSKCSIHIQHMHQDHSHTASQPTAHVDRCGACDNHQEHMNAAKAARLAYRADAESLGRE